MTQSAPNLSTFKPEEVSTLEDAQEKASFKILTPGQLPPEMRLFRILYAVEPHDDNNPKGWDIVFLFYKSPSGVRLAIRQGNIGLPPIIEPFVNGLHGEITINGRRGIWVDGFPHLKGPNLSSVDSWQRGNLQVAWEPNPMLIETQGNIQTIAGESNPGYPLTITLESPDLSLTDLVAIAESVAIP
jgi:hypothetical protein